MKSPKNLDAAFESFKREIAGMSSNAFWNMLGTSIEELREKQQRDTSCIDSSFIISRNNSNFKYSKMEAGQSQECVFDIALSCHTFENPQVASAA